MNIRLKVQILLILVRTCHSHSCAGPVAPRCRTKDPGGGVGSTSRGWRWVGLGMATGGFRDQGVETGRFR